MNDYFYKGPSIELQNSILHRYRDILYKIITDKEVIRKSNEKCRVYALEKLYLHLSKDNITFEYELGYILTYLIDIVKINIVNIYDKNIINNIIYKIVSELSLQNYTFRYFMIFNNSFMYKLNLLNIKLEYDIAECGYITVDNKNIQDNIFSFLRESLETDEWSVCDYINRNIRMNNLELSYYEEYYNIEILIGWRRSELISALKESEFFEEKIETRTNSVGNEIYIYTYPKLGPREFVIKKKRSLPILDNINKSILEYIYRYINNTKFNLDSLCSKKFKTNNSLIEASKILDKPTLVRLFKEYNPNFIGGVYKNMEVAQICDILNNYKTLYIDKDYIESIKYQPGGRYMKQIQEKYIKNNSEIFTDSNKIPVEKLPDVYQKYVDNCGNKNMDIKDILYDIIELGLSNQINRQMNKEQLCKIIRNYILNTLDIYKKII